MDLPTPLFINFRVYWLAFVVYWGGVLFGYDTGIAGGVVNQPFFQSHFGIAGNKKRVDDVSSIVVSSLQAGAFFGALASAPISSAMGRKFTLVVFSAVFAIGAILASIAESPTSGLSLIYSGRVISGIGIGGISAVAPAFVSECSPKEVRGRITGLFQLMVVTGVMVSYFINFGISIHIPSSVNTWRIPFAVQLVPCGFMLLGLFTVKESPRWLVSVGRTEEALENLAYLRHSHPEDTDILSELAEIEAAVDEERAARVGMGLKDAFFGKGNFVRFVIAFLIFVGQQATGQNSVNYYAPQIFQSIGYTGTTASLFASGIYGVVKVVVTSLFIFFGVETLGRKPALIISSLGMGIVFYILGALLKTHPPPQVATAPPPASKAMAGMLYIFVCFYSLGWGPLPWVYVSDIFPTRTRHYGLALVSSTQWLFNFVISFITPRLVTALGWKLFIMFATIDIGGLAVFASLIPETKGRSLEDMDVIFGAVSREKREEAIMKARKELDHTVASEEVPGRNGSDSKV